MIFMYFCFYKCAGPDIMPQHQANTWRNICQQEWWFQAWNWKSEIKLKCKFIATDKHVISDWSTRSFWLNNNKKCVCVCVCVYVCVHACMHACVHECACLLLLFSLKLNQVCDNILWLRWLPLWVKICLYLICIVLLSCEYERVLHQVVSKCSLYMFLH